MQALNRENTPNRDRLFRTPPPEGYFWHSLEEPCPTCGAQLLHDQVTGFWLRCPRCGWKGW